MNYWWVNQKQTYLHEIGGGYMWSPKKQMNGLPHFSYENMRCIRPGDFIFSYANAQVIAIGLARTLCYPFPKPSEFGKAGFGWQNEGWRVDVSYQKLSQPLRTMDHIDKLRDFLPSNKSPLRQDTGGGNQAYLFKLEKPLAVVVAQLISNVAVAMVSGNWVSESQVVEDTDRVNVDQWERQIEIEIDGAESLAATEKDALIKARMGQGRYRALLLKKEKRCRITEVSNPQHLIASHIKPWRSSSNEERLDPENGFLFTPSIDHLFDRGFISFEDNGSIILADVADRSSLERLGVIGDGAKNSIGNLSEGQKRYLRWHRSDLLLG